MQGVVGGPAWDVWLLAWGHKAKSSGDQLLYDVPQPRATSRTHHSSWVSACGRAVGFHGRVQTGWGTEAHAVHDGGHLLWGFSGSLILGMGEGLQ